VELVSHIIDGLVSGALYVVMALGLSIIFGMVGIVNFAHGILYALGAYIAVTLSGGFMSLPFWATLLVAPVCVALMAIIVEVVFLRRFYGRDPMLGLLFTFGLALVGEDAIRMIWGPTGIPYGIPSFLSGSLPLFSVNFSIYRFFIVVVAVVIVALVWLFFNRTPAGLIIRAGSRDGEMVRLLGISLKPTFTLVVGVGAALAALGGVLAAPLAGVQPAMGTDVLTIAFVVVVIGGMGSFWGSIWSGLLVGIVVTLTAAYAPAFSQASMFALMIAVLLIRPRGLFGQKWEAFE
jgi:branched-chain amino acid transport system permease protein